MSSIQSTASADVMARRTVLRLAAFGMIATIAPGSAFAASEAAESTPDLLPNIRHLAEQWVGPGKLPGLVAGFGLPESAPHFIAKGSEGFIDLDPVTPDSLFRVYSMTKPITGMAAMMLIDEGKLALDQPLYDILPKYRSMQVQVTPDGSVTEVQPARTPISIRHLLTHTAGIGYSIIQNGPIKALMEDKGLVPGQISRIRVPGLTRGEPVHGLDVFADRLAEVPLVYEPGTKWSYSMSLDLLGRVIEVVSGQRFDQFLQQRLFDPLGMSSTFFQVPESESGRLTTNYAVFVQRLVPIDRGDDSIFLDEPPFPFGGAGLVSSPRDYHRFLRMLANFGTLDGKRIMSEQAVRLATGNLLPEGVSGPATLGQPSHFGAGGRVGIGEEAGIFGWAGAAGTVGMVDMRRGLTSSIFVQFMPPDALDFLPQFQKALRDDVMAMMEQRS